MNEVKEMKIVTHADLNTANEIAREIAKTTGSFGSDKGLNRIELVAVRQRAQELVAMLQNAEAAVRS